MVRLVVCFYGAVTFTGRGIHGNKNKLCYEITICKDRGPAVWTADSNIVFQDLR